jgi:hypothetical protein
MSLIAYLERLVRSLAALPPDVRKGFAFQIYGYFFARLSLASGGIASTHLYRSVGKPEAFRTSSGEAAEGSRSSHSYRLNNLLFKIY